MPKFDETRRQSLLRPTRDAQVYFDPEHIASSLMARLCDKGELDVSEVSSCSSHCFVWAKSMSVFMLKERESGI